MCWLNLNNTFDTKTVLKIFYVGKELKKKQYEEVENQKFELEEEMINIKSKLSTAEQNTSALHSSGTNFYFL